MSDTITAADINTPLVGASIETAGVYAGQDEAESFANDTIPLATITPSVTGGSGDIGFSPNGPGGSADLTLAADVIDPGAGSGVTLTATAVGGDGGSGGSDGYDDLPGGQGGDATTNLSEVTIMAAGSTAFSLVAQGGASGSGIGGAGASASLTGSTIDAVGDPSAAALNIQLEATGSNGGYNNTSQDTGFPGGAGGSAAATLAGNTLAAASIALVLTATGGAGGAETAFAIAEGSPPNEPNGTASVAVTNNQISLTTPGGALDLTLGGQAVSFSGNSLQGGGASTLVLAAATASFAIDTAAGTIAIDGPGANTLAGFTTFDASAVTSGDNTFNVGSADQEVELGGGFTAVTLTPGSGNLTITGATQSNLALDFLGFGSEFATVAQLLADVSTPGADSQVISLPTGQTITLEGGPIAFNALNAAFSTSEEVPPPPAGNLPASVINTPVVGGLIGFGPDGQSVAAVFDNDLLTAIDLSPSVKAGAGISFVTETDYLESYLVGVGGAASLTLQDDIVGVGSAGPVTLNATATGGGGASVSYFMPVAGGNGGSATALLGGITEADGNPVTLAETASGGVGGVGNTGGPPSNGGAGGSALATLSNSTLDVAGDSALTIDVTADGGGGGMGSSNPNFPGSYGNGGAGGSSTAELTGNAFSAADVQLSVAAAVAAAALPGSNTVPVAPGTNPGSGTPGAIGLAALGVTDNQVAITAPGGTLTLSLEAPNAAAGLTGALTFTGNSFTGAGDSTLDLSLASGSYAIDAASGSIAIAGSAANSLSGFDVFDAVGVTSGSNSFIAGPTAATIETGGGTTTIQLGAAVTTVVITPQAGDIDVVGATASNVVLDFQGFGAAFDSLAQVAAATSEPGGAEQITLPDGSIVAIAGPPIPLNASDVSLPGGVPILPVVTLGAGASVLSLVLSDLGQAAEFTISVDGAQVGGVQTLSADGSLGEQQQFDVLGTFAPGANTATIDLLNAATAPLSVVSAAFDGTPLAALLPTLSAAGDPTTFGFTADGSLVPVTVGAGPDTLALAVSERAAPAGAQFTISVDGTQVGGVQTTVADLAAGEFQTFDVLGDFATGPHTVSVDYLNADDSLLAVDSASIDGAPVAGSAMVLSNSGAAAFGFNATGSLSPVVVGSGPDTLALTLSQRGEPAGAEFTVSVDGAQIGGVQTTAADATLGQSQEFDVFGDFGAGSTISIDYLNASNSLLDVLNATIDGAAVAGSALVLDNDGAGGFGFSGPPNGTVAIGAGADTLALTVAQQDQPTGALFTIDVDGAQIGGVQSVTANAGNGLSQTLDVLGNFAAGANTVTVTYLDAANSLLQVEGATFDGAAVGGSAVTLSNDGSASFGFSGVAAPAGAVALGNGPDQLALVLAERGQPTGALFTVDVDGTQIGGVQSVTADSTAGQAQTFDVLGDFAPGGHAVSIDYLNADNSLLQLESAALNGATISGAPQTLSNVGSQGFSFLVPTASASVPVNVTPDTLVLNLAQDYGAANAQFTIAVDGVQVGGVQTATAIEGSGQSQAFDVSGSFSGQHTVAVDFLNAATSGGTAGTLFLDGASLDGAALPGSTLTLTSDGAKSFAFSH